MYLKNALLCLLFATGMHAQTVSCDYSIKGTITDFHDGTPLDIAQIYIKELQRSYTTTVYGGYSIDGLCPGIYTLYITHVSCDDKQVEVELIDRHVEKNIQLEHHQLEQVSVIADVHQSSNSSALSTFIKQEQIDTYSGASLGDALNSLPGVSALKTGHSVVKPIVHGLHSSRLVLVHDGMRLQDQEWGVEHAPNIDINTASSIQVVKGANALRYGGDAIAGTIILRPQRILVKDTLMGKLILNAQTNGRGGSMHTGIHRFKKSGWYQKINLTYKRLGDYTAPDYVLSNTGSEVLAAQLGVGFKKFEHGFNATYSFYDTRLGILRASHVGNVSDLVRSINLGQPQVVNNHTHTINAPRQEVVHHGLRIDTYKRFPSLGKLELDYAIQFNNRKEYDIRIGNNRNRAAMDIDLLTQNMSAFLKIDKYDDLEINTGLDGTYQINTPSASTGVRRLIPDYTSYKVGAYASLVKKTNSGLLLDVGLRYDQYRINAQKFYITSRWQSLGYDRRFPQFEVREEGTQIYTEPEFVYGLWGFSAGVKQELNDRYEWSVNLSSANRAPNPGELFSEGLHHALATIELGELDLEKEQSYKLNAGFHIRNNALDIAVNPYYNRINNFIQLIPTGVETTTRGAFPVWQYEQVNASIWGIDLSYSYQFKKSRLLIGNTSEKLVRVNNMFQLDGSISYIYGTDHTRSQPLIDMPPLQWVNRLTWQDTGVKGLHAYLSNRTVFERTRFPDFDYSAQVPLDTGGFTTQQVRISQPPPAYSLWDVGVEFAFAKAKLRLHLTNLFNTSYRDYLNKQRFYADDIGRNVEFQLLYNF